MRLLEDAINKNLLEQAVAQDQTTLNNQEQTLEISDPIVEEEHGNGN